jgi:hypothetical protein
MILASIEASEMNKKAGCYHQDPEGKNSDIGIYA